MSVTISSKSCSQKHITICFSSSATDQSCTRNCATARGLSIVEADLAAPETVLQELSDVDTAVLAATAWGGADTFAVNVDANVKIARYLAEKGGRKIVYLSTASILDRRLDLLDGARIFGTEYIRSKRQMVEELESVSEEIDILGLFPTLVLGGDETKPYSHFARLLAKARTPGRG